MKDITSFFLRIIIILYQKAFSPLFPQKCRYIPTCSQYALEAIKKYGPYKGSWLTVKRVFSCHPWGGHGHDPLL